VIPSPFSGRQTALSRIVNLSTANILWPFLVLPSNLVHLVSSFWPGHSHKVASHLRQGTGDEPGGKAE
jgi:hypothetical protein